MKQPSLDVVCVSLPRVPRFLCPAAVWNFLSDGRGDYRVHLQQHESGSNVDSSNTIGAFYRDEDGLALVLGTLDTPKDRQQLRCVTPTRDRFVLVHAAVQHVQPRVVLTGTSGHGCCYSDEVLNQPDT